jgi:hypothetical protein
MIERKLMNVIIDGKEIRYTNQFKFRVPTVEKLHKTFNL